MFTNAKSFNIDISKWSVKKVTTMANMFKGATKFAQVWCSDDWRSVISNADFEKTLDDVNEFGSNPVLNEGGTGKVMCCNTGHYYAAITKTCLPCSPGEYNSLTHVTDKLPSSCVTCPRNTFAPIEGLPGCSDCAKNQYR